MAEVGTGSLYQRFVGPLLSRDDGADAEQLSQLTLQALAQASLRRNWPLVSSSLAGLGLSCNARICAWSKRSSAAASSTPWV